MNWTTRAFGVALLTGVAGGMTSFVSPQQVYAAPAIKLENKQLADLVRGAQADAKAGRNAEALAKAKQADAISGKPAELTRSIHGMIVAYAVAAKDYNSALAQIEKMLAAKEGNRNENLKQALSISVQMGNKAKVADYAKELGGNLDDNTRLYIAGQLANAGQYREALAQAKPLLDDAQPPEAALKFQQAVYFKMNDSAGRRASLERLVSAYPKAEYWHDLLQLARNERGLTDEQSMDIYRLRLALNDLKTAEEYSEMAQVALVAGYPNEAKTVLDKAAAAKLLAGERSARLVKMTNDRVTADAAMLADLKKKAATDPNASVKLGLVYWTYGKYPEAEAAIRAGIARGKLADPDGAKIALGHVLFSSGKKQDAVAQFNAVPRNSKQASIARLWSIYARRG